MQNRVNLKIKFFWYKAEPHENFRIGAKQFWDHHEKNYINSSEEEDDNDFQTKFNNMNRKNKPSIAVKKTVY